MRVRYVLLAALLSLAASAGAQLPGRLGAPDTLVAISAGNATTCVTTARGAGYCWGELGERNGKVYRILDAAGRPAQLRSASPGWLTLCAQTLDGAVACDPFMAGLTRVGWTPGASCAYRLCVLPLPHLGPMPAGALRAVDAGWMHACALSLDGAAFCWGRNDMGQLGNGSWAPDTMGNAGDLVRVPTAVATERRFATLSAGENTTCGITEPGAAIYCWGYGQSGQTGDSSVATYCSGERPYYTKPCSNAVPARVRVEMLPGARGGESNVRFAQVSVGMRLACAVSVDGAAYCWGGNYRCALGRCRESDSPLAHRISLPGRAAEIGAGYWHACARTLDGRIFCWGQNTEGQLGSLVSANLAADGLPPDYRDTTDRRAQSAAYNDDPCFLGGRCSPAPVEVSPGRRWSALTVGSNHACALADDDGGIYCWGGTAAAAVGLGARLVPCVNRSTQWKDVRCQPSPVRVPGLPRLVARATSAAGQSATSAAPDSIRVIVSRRVARVIFPRDDAGAWGWSALTDREYLPSYLWSVQLDGADGPRSMRLLIGRRDSSAKRFPSLDSLVRTGTPELCTPGMIANCTSDGMSALVEDRHVVLVLRDSAAIARLFGLRPATMEGVQSRPADTLPVATRRVTAEYVEPQIALPDAKAFADARATRRRFEESISWISRRIDARDAHSGAALWVVVGDSIPVQVQESRCHYDSCIVTNLPVPDTLFTIGDSGVAEVRGSSSLRSRLALFGASAQLVGRRPGRTSLRIALPPFASDTAPSREPPGRTLTREVVVTRPLRRIAFVPNPDSVRVGTPISARLMAVDDQGRRYENPPAQLSMSDGARSFETVTTDSIPRVAFSTPGTRTIVAKWGVLTDTLTIRVLPAP